MRKPDEFVCERCGAIEASTPWPHGWTQCGTSRHDGDIAAWCPPCGLVMPFGSLEIFRRMPDDAADDCERESVFLPDRLPDYKGRDLIVIPRPKVTA